MSEIKELNFEEIAMVSGGNANSNFERGSTRTANTKNSGAGNSGGRSIYDDVDSCGSGIIGGLVAGSVGGPLGMAAGIVGGMIAGQCTKDSFSNKSDCGSKDRANNFAGQCRW
ncbi:hypothetical protein M977_01392 [Buttiauxella gaviniae ATCC 51604]|uniref:Bacteriocin n=1 Tax=Buttiauxella gaviniae ATCC 51604 TaxID=1354253 RepID=A0A1B7I3D2_9ENTR|nr:hypothetical protein [Buttiauxella gaviniae]OAT22767.1 hypothetical protein M977_01392 [Buttiauxella gaviniae ATCC 51604]